MQNIVIVGSSGHASVLADLARLDGRYNIVGLVDRFRAPGEWTLGLEVLGREEDLPALAGRRALAGVVVAIGDNAVRATVARRIRELCPELAFVTLVHPRAVVAGDVILGEGTVVMAGAVVNPGASVGRLCILNTHCSLDHDSRLDDHASLAPGVVTGGRCHVGECAAVGIGAVLLQDVRVGAHAVVGGGSLVIGEIDACVVAYGSPARVVRSRKPGDPYLGGNAVTGRTHAT